MPYPPYLIAITFVLLTHLFYQVYFFIGMIRIRQVQKGSETQGVSVIIAARNEFENLKKHIPILLKQSYSDFEVIIVNDRSVDESHEYLMEIDKNPKVRVVFVDSLPDHINSKKYALTLGIKAAKNNLLLLTDADCEPSSENWIAEMISGYRNDTRIVIGFSPYQKEKGLLNALIRFETHFTGIQYLASASNKKPYMGVGRNLSYHKDLFLERKGYNGFRGITGGDDDLFVNKNSRSDNTTVILSPDSTVISVPKKSWKDYINQKIRHLSVGKYYSAGDKIFLGIYSLFHLLSWVSAIVSIILNIYPLFIGMVFLFGFLLLVLNFWMLNRKSGSTVSLLTVPFLDVIYGFFYIFVGLRTLITRKVEWTT